MEHMSAGGGPSPGQFMGVPIPETGPPRPIQDRERDEPGQLSVQSLIDAIIKHENNRTNDATAFSIPETGPPRPIQDRERDAYYPQAHGGPAPEDTPGKHSAQSLIDAIVKHEINRNNPEITFPGSSTRQFMQATISDRERDAIMKRERNRERELKRKLERREQDRERRAVAEERERDSRRMERMFAGGVVNAPGVGGGGGPSPGQFMRASVPETGPPRSIPDRERDAYYRQAHGGPAPEDTPGQLSAQSLIDAIMKHEIARNNPAITVHVPPRGSGPSPRQFMRASIPERGPLRSIQDREREAILQISGSQLIFGSPRGYARTTERPESHRRHHLVLDQIHQRRNRWSGTRVSAADLRPRGSGSGDGAGTRSSPANVLHQM
ncbi:uncharacterized protein LOC119557633 isoform X1 [Drosophila subpulchrella]|uniref:uncharacterized protein LOC119557633 isoform X1 n=1 Tax=Drosophila subpulchrella TaxID=1486046 RepID=UPI0018A17AFE|nr:uncharacterized protein LOC119557633 isoform X1 [Drosophila subpulchrella]